MSGWQEPIGYEATELFTREERPAFCALEAPEVGIRLNLDGLEYDPPRLGFRALVTWCFPRDYARAFQRIDHALVLVIENAATGQSLATNLVDPHKRHRALQGPNYVAPASVREDRFKTSFLEAPLEIEVPPASFRPSVFLRVVLHDHVSNVMAIALEELSAVSYEAGVPALLRLLGDEAEE